ncbi:MAG: tRNA pseudouridine(55) synthase TruB [Anaerolineales bacterium]|nr:tRNA pseudouridine(55) synthase TruB [Anaerolineales bacterium]
MKRFGLILVDKPTGPTSHKVVSIVRRETGVRKVGHAGTLDPRASGVLILCMGAATRLSEYLSTASKRYEAVIRFGASTKTYDAEGDAVRITGAVPTEEDIKAILPEFTGKIEQIPPPYSAIKIKGKKAYELARAGKEFDLAARDVTIYHMALLEYRPPDLVLEIECSAGTYIRSLAHDLGEQLGTGAHLANLRRTKVGHFTIEDCVSLRKLELGFIDGTWVEYMRPAVDALPDLQRIEVNGKIYEDITFGRLIPADPSASGTALAIGPDGDLIAILEAVEDGAKWHPKKVFNR